ncbi:hypothetical protein chiPu_0031433, partial [Chiloscyllium punctatum]|nr:hypothetical protein [Chiloscyllium punctatum]
AERIVGGDEIPFRAAVPYQIGADRVRGRPGIEGPLDRVRRAVFAGQVGGSRARCDQRRLGAAHDLVDGEPDGRVRHVGDRIDLLLTDPAPRDRGADVCLVLVVGRYDLDPEVRVQPHEILGRHLGRRHRPLTGIVRIRAGRVVEYADLQRARGVRRCRRGRAGGQQRQRENAREIVHLFPPILCCCFQRSSTSVRDFAPEQQIITLLFAACSSWLRN